MISRTTERFRKALADLPARVQRQARAAYRLFQQNPYHPSLHFRQVHATRPIYSARISLNYRALGLRVAAAAGRREEAEQILPTQAADQINQQPQPEDEMIWFWIGSHDEYDELLDQL